MDLDYMAKIRGTRGNREKRKGKPMEREEMALGGPDPTEIEVAP